MSCYTLLFAPPFYRAMIRHAHDALPLLLLLMLPCYAPIDMLFILPLYDADTSCQMRAICS